MCVGVLADGLRLFCDSFHSPHFLSYNAANLPPWLCLSLLFADRSLDLVAQDERQASEWFFGLQSLVPFNASFKSMPTYRWHVMRLKVQFAAKQAGCTVAKQCRRIITKARQEMRQIHIQKQQQQAEAAAAAATTAIATAAVVELLQFSELEQSM